MFNKRLIDNQIKKLTFPIDEKNSRTTKGRKEYRNGKPVYPEHDKEIVFRKGR